jgi:DNA-directed RNA polymerase specialized sigma24 family protein
MTPVEAARARSRHRRERCLSQSLAAAQAGVPWALTRLYEELAPAVHGYLRAQGAGDPEDLTSEVFLGAFAALERFAGTESQFRSWVFTIAHRRLTDERRRRGRRPGTETLHGDAQAAGSQVAGGDTEAEALSRLGDQLSGSGGTTSSSATPTAPNPMPGGGRGACSRRSANDHGGCL